MYRKSAKSHKPAEPMSGLLSLVLGILFTTALNATDTNTDISSGFPWIAETVDCYQPYEGFHATFVHEFISVLDKRGAPLEGEIFVAKDGRFNMQYHTPAQKQVVFNGKKIRAWDSGSNLVVEHTGQGNALFESLVTLFGATRAQLASQFRVRRLNDKKTAGTSGKYSVIELVPRAASALTQKIVVTLGDCPTVRRVIIVDRAGNMIRLKLRNIALQKTFDRGTFRFQAPRGIHVVRP